MLEYLIQKQTTIKIDGFRSLLDFSIDIRPGLNVLVGPNGSGKTNFIEFLDFLNRCIHGGASRAVSIAGGVNRVFSIENQKKQAPSLSCRIKGISKLAKYETYEIDNTDYFKFEYSINIKFSKKHSTIYITSEEIKFYQFIYSDRVENCKLVGSIKVTRNNISDQAPPKVIIGPRLRSSTRSNPVSYRRSLYKNRTFEDLIDKLGYENLQSDESMLVRRRIIPALDGIYEAVTRGSSFNVKPEKVRIPDELTREPFIDADGSGLTSSLHFLRNINKEGRIRRFIYSRIDPESFNIILAWTKIVFPDLSDILVTPDPINGKYSLQLVIGAENQKKIPLQAISDGTIKWLSLVVLILTRGGSYSIEEPENFLHPQMQKSLIEIIRETIENSENDEKFIISTHSETILNCCNPDELIMFRFENGHTRSSKIKDPDLVLSEVNRTGFGLGKYYVSNALS